jgi:hypothetical protein
MKKMFATAALLLALASSDSLFASSGSVIKVHPASSHNGKVTALKPIPIYFWILYGSCFRLVRLNDPGYTDQQGNYHEGLSLTFMGPQNFIGTTQICPPEGEAYC